MSCREAIVSDANLEKLDEMTNKLNRGNKNIKLVLELLQKLHEATEKKIGYHIILCAQLHQDMYNILL